MPGADEFKFEVEWRCDHTQVTAWEKEFIQKRCAMTAKLYAAGGRQVRIRSAIDNNTKKTEYGKQYPGGKKMNMVADKNGDHITAEFFHKLKKIWVTFHYYVVPVQNLDGTAGWAKKKNTGMLPENPQIFWKTATKVAASEGQPVFNTQLVWA